MGLFGKKRKLPRTGDPAPSFSLRDLEGAERSLERILAGGPALLAFFKVSCPVCQYTFPFLERLAQAGSLRVFGVSQDDAKATVRFNRDQGVTFPTLLDEEPAGYPASNAFGISSVPSLFMVEADGTVSMFSEGFVKRDLAELGGRAGTSVFPENEYVPEWKSG